MTSGFAVVTISVALLAAAPAKAPPAAAQGAQDCGKNLQCLILAAKTCSQAKAVHASEMKLAGTRYAGAWLYEIKGRDGRRCLFQKTQTAASAKLEPQQRSAAAAKGMNVVQLEKEVNDQMAGEVGKLHTCSALPNDLAQQIQQWRDGSFSTGDLCQGEMKWEIPDKNGKFKKGM